MSEVYAQLQGQESLLVGGDGRCDSPGSSSKYCTYTLMDSATKQIVHSGTVTRDMVSCTYMCLYTSQCTRNRLKIEFPPFHCTCGIRPMWNIIIHVKHNVP